MWQNVLISLVSVACTEYSYIRYLRRSSLMIELTQCFVFYRYTIGMFKKGYQKTLDVDDLYNPIKSDRSTILGDRLERLVFSFCLLLFLQPLRVSGYHRWNALPYHITLPHQVFISYGNYEGIYWIRYRRFILMLIRRYWCKY